MLWLLVLFMVNVRISSSKGFIVGFERTHSGFGTTIADFTKRFGIPADTSTGYTITAPWQSGLSNGSSAGGIIGLLVRILASELAVTYDVNTMVYHVLIDQWVGS